MRGLFFILLLSSGCSEEDVFILLGASKGCGKQEEYECCRYRRDDEGEWKEHAEIEICDYPDVFTDHGDGTCTPGGDTADSASD